jgi:hypothetical protein
MVFRILDTSYQALHSPDCVTTVATRLFRMVRPMRRDGLRNRYYVRRIPADARGKAIGLKLIISLGDGETRSITIVPQAQACGSLSAPMIR